MVQFSFSLDCGHDSRRWQPDVLLLLLLLLLSMAMLFVLTA